MTPEEPDMNRADRVTALREGLDAYVSGRCGVRFEALMRFAGPLFDLYDVDWKAHDDLAAASRDADELTTMLAVLDTARLLWAFYALDDDRSIERLPDVEDAMLGRAAGDEERSNLLVLLSLLEEHWQSFTGQERAAATDTPGYTLPEFDLLLSEYQGRVRLRPRKDTSMHGPHDLELPEALAIFAEPLLRQPSMEDNPDLVEARVERAQAYWDLAMTPDEEFDAHLQRVVDAFADSDEEADVIRQEARRMIDRFRRLFPDLAHGSS